MKNTAIEWAHHTVNFWWGCTKVSEACAHCYAEMMNKIFGHGRAVWGPTGARWIRTEAALVELANLAASAKERGVRERVFVNSMSDTFEDREDLHVVRCMMLACFDMYPELDFLLLTKRPENVRRMVPTAWLDVEWPKNVWLGTTIENPQAVRTRAEELARCPAPVLFWSCEPLLEDLGDVSEFLERCGSCGSRWVDWVICGGESGHKARPMHPEWARSLRDQCAAAGVPFFFKQWGEWAPRGEYWKMGDQTCLQLKAEFPRGMRLTVGGSVGDGRIEYLEQFMVREGKKAAGRVLDGAEHSAVPEAVLS